MMAIWPTYLLCEFLGSFKLEVISICGVRITTNNVLNILILWIWKEVTILPKIKIEIIVIIIITNGAIVAVTLQQAI